jgi:hypothetical protein
VNDWFFAHAGDTGGKTLKELRSALEDEVDAKGYGADVLLGKKGLLEARLHHRPWWEKEGDEGADSENRLRRHVQSLGVSHMVIGHQPGNVRFSDGSTRKKGTMIQKFDGLIFLIDVGMSEAIDYSQGAMLHISGGKNPKAIAIYPKKDSEFLWRKARTERKTGGAAAKRASTVALRATRLRSGRPALDQGPFLGAAVRRGQRVPGTVADVSGFVGRIERPPTPGKGGKRVLTQSASG